MFFRVCFLSEHDSYQMTMSGKLHCNGDENIKYKPSLHRVYNGHPALLHPYEVLVIELN